MHTAGHRTSGLETALAVWYRRKWLVLLIFVALFAGTVSAARSLPNVYESTVTVLVERPPQRLSSLSAGDDMSTNFELETRLRSISQRILSRSRLQELITRFDLYPHLRGRASPETVAEQMRQDIRLQFKEIPELGGLTPTFAFTLSYQGDDPDTAARVANALAADYVQESARIREQQTVGTTDFLRAQLDEAERALRAQERRINEFTVRHNGELPEQQTANLEALGRLNAQVVVIMERRRELARQLAELPPGGGNALAARLAEFRKELADLRMRETDQHPDVVRLKQEIADLERRLSAQGGSAAQNPKDARAMLDSEIAALPNEEQAVRREIATYEQRIQNGPLREQEFQQLSRGYATAKDLYQSLLQRYQDAQLAARVAQQHPQGEQFRIVDPAVASRQPAGPHRSRFLLLGLMVSVGAAVGTALLAETIDTSFHTVGGVGAFTSVPVLASIPPIITEADARRRRIRFGLAALAAALVVAAVVSFSSHLGRSNGSLVFLMTRDDCLRPGRAGHPSPPSCIHTDAFHETSGSVHSGG